uniref:hypothetical protein n=1 Tax=Streptomyces sp. FR1 TaxID=349971 RepID=UPI0015E856E6|nr:hypothetical protein [Streptomyces sp. FR1]
MRKNIPLAGDVIVLDGEWQRRYPNMRGTLACERCVIDNGWNCCTTTKGGFGSHHLEHGTHRALATLYPPLRLVPGSGAVPAPYE